MNNRNHRQILIEQLRRQSIQKRTQALKEAVQKQAMNAPIAGASSSGGGSSSLYPDRVDIFIVGQEKVAGFACMTKDMYNDGDTPIYYGTLSLGGEPFGFYLYWNGKNWGLDDDLNPPYRAVGPTTKNNLYGTYLGIGAGEPNLKVSAYSQAASIECPTLPSGGTASSTITGGTVTWSWDGIPTSIGGNQWTVTGTVFGFSLNNSPETTLTGDFLLGFDSGTSQWSLRNNGPMTLGPYVVDVLSIPTGTAPGPSTPDSAITGSFDPGSISGTIIYQT